MSTLLAAKAALLATVEATQVLTLVARDDWTPTNAGDEVAVVQTASDTLQATVIDGYGRHGWQQERHTFSIAVCYPIGTNVEGHEAAHTALEAKTEALKDALRPALFAGLTFYDGPRGWKITRTTPSGTLGDAKAATHLAQRIFIQADCEFQEE